MKSLETERIEQAYARRDRDIERWRYSPFNPASLYITQQRERAILRTLSQHDLEELQGKRILDLGCGDGHLLRSFLDYGALPENLSGIDLLPDRIDRARQLSTNLDLRIGNAEHLPYDDGSFDIVTVFTVFTSILDMPMKQRVAEEILRVLTDGGVILWFDYHVNSPRNRDVRGVDVKEIRTLFPTCAIHLRKTTLAPPLARLIVPLSWMLASILEKIPLLRTHYLGVIHKPEATSAP